MGSLFRAMSFLSGLTLFIAVVNAAVTTDSTISASKSDASESMSSSCVLLGLGAAAGCHGIQEGAGASSSTASITPSPTTTAADALITSDPSSSSSCPLLGLGQLHGCDGGLVGITPGNWPNPTSQVCQSFMNSGVFRGCERSGQPYYTFTSNGYGFGNPYYEGNKINSDIPNTLANYCSSKSASKISDFFATAEITPGPYIPETKFETKYISTSESVSWSGYTPYYYVSDYTFVADPPCCLSCTLYGGDVQVYNWPTPAPTPATSTLINDEGFTFISPSVYVAFRSLYAKDLCGRVGESYNATTIAFDASELSTTTGYHYDTALYTSFPPELYYLSMTFTEATFGDQTSCMDITKSFYQDVISPDTSTYDDYAGFSDVQDFVSSFKSTPRWLYHYTVTYNPCSPLLSVPTQVYAIDSRWSTCGPGISAFFDPPYTLSAGKGLAPISTSAARNGPISSSSPTSTAAAGSTAIPSTPTPTNTPSIDPTPSVSPSTSTQPTLTLSIVPQPTALPETTVVTIITPQPPTSNDPPPSSTNDPPESPSTTPQISTESNSPTHIIPTLNSPPPSPADTAIHSAIIDGPSSTFAPAPSPSPQPTFIAGTQTLIVGGPAITVSGTVLSLPSGGSSVIVDGTAKPISSLLSTPDFIIGSQTLIPGASAITISGTIVLSLQPEGSNVVVGTETQALSKFLGPSTTQGQGLGGIIATIGGLGGSPTTAEGTGTPSNGTVPFLGEGSRSRGRSSLWVLGSGFGAWLLGYCVC